jgi:hypothetical protein
MVQISAADSYGKGATVSGKRVKESHVPLAICRIVTCNVPVNIVSVHQIVTVTPEIETSPSLHAHDALVVALRTPMYL